MDQWKVHVRYVGHWSCRNNLAGMMRVMITYPDKLLIVVYAIRIRGSAFGVISYWVHVVWPGFWSRGKRTTHPATMWSLLSAFARNELNLWDTTNQPLVWRCLLRERCTTYFSEAPHWGSSACYVYPKNWFEENESDARRAIPRPNCRAKHRRLLR